LHRVIVAEIAGARRSILGQAYSLVSAILVALKAARARASGRSLGKEIS